ncbi:MAG: hypothetical protein ACD_65C00027G0002, partial [uncultured bacterium]
VPDGVELNDVELLYGVTDDNLFVISTYPGWELYQGQGSVEDLDIFENLYSDIRGSDETLFLFDFEEMNSYLDIWQSLQDALNQGLDNVINDEGDDLDLSFYLDILEGAIFGTDASRYTVEMSGVVRVR